jgi:hypothetical protein
MLKKLKAKKNMLKHADDTGPDFCQKTWQNTEPLQ